MADLDVFTVAGQSNTVGQGGSTGSPDPPADSAFMHESGVPLTQLDDPMQKTVSSPWQDANTGSAWPAFADEYYTRVGRKAAYVFTALGSTAQAKEVGDSTGEWDPEASGNLADQSITDTQNAISEIRDAGHTVTYRGVLWHQGTRDANAIDSGTIAKSEYQSAFENMIAEWRAQFTPAVPFWVFQTGHKSGGDTAGFQDVRAAQQEVVDTTSNVYMVSTIQKDFPEDGRMQDTFHYTQTGYNDMGREGGGSVSSVLTTSSQSSAAVLTTAAGVLSTTPSAVIESGSGEDTTAPTISNYTASGSGEDTTAPTISNYTAS